MDAPTPMPATAGIPERISRERRERLAMIAKTALLAAAAIAAGVLIARFIVPPMDPSAHVRLPPGAAAWWLLTAEGFAVWCAGAWASARRPERRLVSALLAACFFFAAWTETMALMRSQ